MVNQLWQLKTMLEQLIHTMLQENFFIGYATMILTIHRILALKKTGITLLGKEKDEIDTILIV